MLPIRKYGLGKNPRAPEKPHAVITKPFGGRDPITAQELYEICLSDGYAATARELGVNESTLRRLIHGGGEHRMRWGTEQKLRALIAKREL
jgi:hypothetical protein